MSALLQPATSRPRPVITASTLISLLHLKNALCAFQSPAGGYGKADPLSLAKVTRHLSGEVTVAIAPISGDHALFAAIDVDERFPELASRVIRPALFDLGGQGLIDACFLTNGSDEERGKIIVAFVKPMSARPVREFIRAIKRTIQRESRLPSGMLDEYPKEKTGGLVRILGRNLKRNGPLESALNFDGEPVDLTNVSPLSPAAFLAMVPKQPRTLPWVERLLTTPWLAKDGTRRHIDLMLALARECMRQNLQRSDFYAMMDRIKGNSPELTGPSVKNLDTRNVLVRAREWAWATACLDPSSFRAKVSPSNREFWRAYRAICGLVAQRGLRASKFQLDYQTIGDAMDRNKGQAYRAVLTAEAAGLLVRHDPGSRHEFKHKGVCTTFGLVGEGETAEQVLNLGKVK
jgi:hypothetical protein